MIDVSLLVPPHPEGLHLPIVIDAGMRRLDLLLVEAVEVLLDRAPRHAEISDKLTLEKYSDWTLVYDWGGKVLLIVNVYWQVSMSGQWTLVYQRVDVPNGQS